MAAAGPARVVMVSATAMSWIFVLFALLSSGSGWASTTAITGVSGAAFGDPGEVALRGFAFIPKKDILVDQLGLWDQNNDGLFGSHEVGIYDYDGSGVLGSLRASTIVQSLLLADRVGEALPAGS